MKHIVKLITIWLFSLFLFSCSGTINSVDGTGKGAGHVYIVSEDIAKRLMMAAMKSQFNPSDIKVLAAPNLGFSSIVQYGIDKDTVELVALKAKGISKNGENVNGYVFSAEHRGTAPAAGIPTIDRLLAHIVIDAEALGSTAEFSQLIN